MRNLAPYPVDGEWRMTSIRAPVWLRDLVNEAAERRHAEPWVCLLDMLARGGHVPPDRVPAFPLAVRRRYGADLRADGTMVGEEPTIDRGGSDERDEDESLEAPPERTKRGSRKAKIIPRIASGRRTG